MLDPEQVEEVLSREPGIINKAVAHPRWGGHPVPIQLAAERGNTKVIEVLLRNGVDPNHGADTYGGWSALHLTAYWGHLEAAALLRDRGAQSRGTMPRGRGVPDSSRRAGRSVPACGAGANRRSPPYT